MVLRRFRMASKRAMRSPWPRLVEGVALRTGILLVDALPFLTEVLVLFRPGGCSLGVKRHILSCVSTIVPQNP